MSEKEFIAEIIETIWRELDNSTFSTYVCENGKEIETDVGYVFDWFEEYAKVLRKKYSRGAQLSLRREDTPTDTPTEGG